MAQHDECHLELQKLKIPRHQALLSSLKHLAQQTDHSEIQCAAMAILPVVQQTK